MIMACAAISPMAYRHTDIAGSLEPAAGPLLGHAHALDDVQE